MEITGHKKLQYKVYQTTYDNGSKIIVNYSDKTINIDDIKINAKDFEKAN